MSPSADRYIGRCPGYHRFDPIKNLKLHGDEQRRNAPAGRAQNLKYGRARRLRLHGIHFIRQKVVWY